MTQARDELRLFQEFLVASRFPVLPETVESRLPPEPDIACRCADGTELRFELVEIVDEQFAQMVSDQVRPPTVDLWLEQVERFVRENLAGSPFRRVWVYDANTKSVVLESALRST